MEKFKRPILCVPAIKDKQQQEKHQPYKTYPRLLSDVYEISAMTKFSEKEATLE